MADSVAAPAPAPAPGGPAEVDGPPGLAAVVLAAGEGRRLLPITRILPKPLCPVANRALVDLGIENVRVATTAVAVNVHHGRDAMEAHLAAHPDVQVSIEHEQALGTAGALGLLRPWLDGRAALVVNGDTWSCPDLASFAAGWDGERVRILVVGTEPFGPRSAIVASILPWSEIVRLEPVPAGLYEACWHGRAAAGAIETVAYDGPFVDCGTPARYLEANLRAASMASGSTTGGSVVHPTAVVDPGAVVESSVVGPGARIDGRIRDSVVWGDTVVHRGEDLIGAVRATDRLTVVVR